MNTTTTGTRIFLVDDHRVVRLGLRQLFEHAGGLSVAGEAGSGDEALKKIPQARPDLVIVDIAMEGMNGIELTRRLKRENPDVRVLIVSMHDDAYYIEGALDAGADGYVLKDNVTDLVLEAVDALLAGHSYLCNDVARKIKS